MVLGKIIGIKIKRNNVDNIDKMPEGYVKIERIEPATEQTFEVVLLDGNIFPKNANEYLAKLNQHGSVNGYCRDLEDFKNYDMDYNHIVVVTGHRYRYNSYDKVITGEVIPKAAISHFRKKK